MSVPKKAFSRFIDEAPNKASHKGNTCTHQPCWGFQLYKEKYMNRKSPLDLDNERKSSWSALARIASATPPPRRTPSDRPGGTGYQQFEGEANETVPPRIINMNMVMQGICRRPTLQPWRPSTTATDQTQWMIPPATLVT